MTAWSFSRHSKVPSGAEDPCRAATNQSQLRSAVCSSTGSRSVAPGKECPSAASEAFEARKKQATASWDRAPEREHVGRFAASDSRTDVNRVSLTLCTTLKNVQRARRTPHCCICDTQPRFIRTTSPQFQCSALVSLAIYHCHRCVFFRLQRSIKIMGCSWMQRFHLLSCEATSPKLGRLRKCLVLNRL